MFLEFRWFVRLYVLQLCLHRSLGTALADGYVVEKRVVRPACQDMTLDRLYFGIDSIRYGPASASIRQIFTTISTLATRGRIDATGVTMV